MLRPSDARHLAETARDSDTELRYTYHRRFTIHLRFVHLYSMVMSKMKSVTVLIISLLSAGTTAKYIVSDLTRRVVSQPGVSLRRAQRLARRQSSLVETFLPQVDHNQYLINFTVGTPPQSVAAILDTGSTDVFIPSTAHPKCQAGECLAGAFDAATSTSLNILIKDGFKTQFVDPADTDSGDWVDETITIGGSRSVTKAILAVSNSG